MTDTTTTSPTPTAPAPKKRSVGRLLGRIVGVLILLLLVFVAGVYLLRNTFVKMGVERGGSYATGQTTTLNAADLSVAGGVVELGGLDIANPDTYKAKAPNLLTMKKCSVTVETGSLFSDTVQVDEIAIDGLELTLVQDGLKNNLADVLDVIKAKTAAGGSGSATSPGKKLAIKVIRLSGTKVHLNVGATLTLNLGPIELKEPTNPDGRPMRIADVVGKVLINVAKQLAEDPRIPGDLKGTLANATKGLGDLTKNLGKNLDKATKDLQKNVDNLGKGLENLLGGKKDQPK